MTAPLNLRTSAAILETAAHLLTEHDASMTEIAAAAGVGRATLYRYYPTRDALLAALAVQALDEITERVADARLETYPPTRGSSASPASCSRSPTATSSSSASASRQTTPSRKSASGGRYGPVRERHPRRRPACGSPGRGPAPALRQQHHQRTPQQPPARTRHRADRRDAHLVLPRRRASSTRRRLTAFHSRGAVQGRLSN